MKRDPDTNAPRFLGPWVHGAANAPFLCLSWRWIEPEPSPWISRLKIPLTTIPDAQIDAAGHQGGALLEAMGNGTGGGWFHSSEKAGE